MKLKGLTVTNESVLGPHIWDVVDYVFPPQVRSQGGWVRDLLLSKWLLFPMCWGADGSLALAFREANHDRVSLWWKGGCSCHKPLPRFSLGSIWHLGPTMAEGGTFEVDHKRIEVPLVPLEQDLRQQAGSPTVPGAGGTAGPHPGRGSSQRRPCAGCELVGCVSTGGQLVRGDDQLYCHSWTETRNLPRGKHSSFLQWAQLP